MTKNKIIFFQRLFSIITSFNLVFQPFLSVLLIVPQFSYAEEPTPTPVEEIIAPAPEPTPASVPELTPVANPEPTVTPEPTAQPTLEPIPSPIVIKPTPTLLPESIPIQSEGKDKLLMQNSLAGSNNNEVSIAGSATWPSCNFHCDAKDVTVPSLWLEATGAANCTPGVDVLSAALKMTIINGTGTERYAPYLVSDLYVDNHFNHQIVQCLGPTLPRGSNTFDIIPYNWTCGSKVEFRNVVISWTAQASENCSTAPTCSGQARETKCYAGGSKVVEGPLVTNFSATEVCQGDTTQFSDLTTGGKTPYSYYWTFGDGLGVSSVEKPSYTYSSFGTYPVNLEITDSSTPAQTDSQSKNVNVWTTPAADFSASESTCPGMSVSFTNNSLGGSSYSWNFGDGTSSADASPTHTYSASGNYNVTLNVTSDHSCTNSVQKTVTITSCARCGDGVKNQLSEECDGSDGVLEHYTCTSECKLQYVPYCGDGNIDLEEYCDDGNNFNGDGCSSTCQIEPGHIIVDKNLDPQCLYCGGQDFWFYLYEVANPSNPYASMKGQHSLFPEDPPYDFGPLPPGTYRVTEDALTSFGWYNVSTTCINGTLGSNIDPNNIILHAGETITCTFTNNRLGKIQILKSSYPEGSTEDFGFTSNFDLDGGTGHNFTLSDKESVFSAWLTPGSDYSVNEDSLPAGWYQSGFACGDGNSDSNHITVRSGETTQCTFVNSKYGSITVIKDTSPNSPQDFNFTLGEASLLGTINTPFSLDDDPADATLDNSKTFNNLKRNSYTITEDAITGWNATGISCTGIDSSRVYKNPNNREVQLNLEDGENVTCTFTNTQKSSIKVIKNVDLNGDGDYLDENESNVSNWLWNINGSGDYQTGTVQPLVAGTYTISEEQKTGYHVVSFACGETNYGMVESQEVTVTSGQNLICTFLNARDTGTLEVIKELDPRDDPGRFDLKIDDAVYLPAAGDGGSTGAQRVLSGYHTVAEVAGIGSDLSDYNSRIWCTGDEGSYPGTSREIYVGKDENIICTITNTRQTGTVTILKDVDTNGDGEVDIHLSFPN